MKSQILDLKELYETEYDNALLIVQKKTQLNSLPEQCPYSLQELLDKNWFPN
jgi:hypothetical protein